MMSDDARRLLESRSTAVHLLFKKKNFILQFVLHFSCEFGCRGWFFRWKEKRRRLGWLHFDEVRQSLERCASFHRHSKAKGWVYIHRKWANQVESKQELKFNHRRRFWKKSLWKKKKVCGRQHRYSIQAPLDRPQEFWIAIAAIYMTFRDIRARYLSLDEVSNSGGPHSVSLPFVFLHLLFPNCVINRR